MLKSIMNSKSNKQPTMHISLNSLITALAAAFDLAGSSERQHSLRTAYVATRLAKNLDIETKQVEDIYFASLLHDLIPQGSLFDQNLIFEILTGLPLRAEVGTQVAELWKHKQETRRGEYDSGHLGVAARIIYAAEYFENIYCRKQNDEYLLRKTLFAWSSKAVAELDQKIALALQECMREEAFWQDLKENRIPSAARQIAPDLWQQLEIDEIEQVSRSFSLLIDRKNPYTGQHSQWVGVIAGELARLYGLDTGMVCQLRIAGYLHDLGKLSIPEYILNKPGLLNEREMQHIKAHPYNSYAVLSEIEGFENIARWAGNHHERMDGSGYPWGRKDLTICDQIIAVADFYEALTSDRPYRQALKSSEALSLIDKQAKAGKIMPEACELLKQTIAEQKWKATNKLRVIV
ncbi:MAG: HD domain-containing phosphohydrolase [Syntrophomonas sp.]